MHRVTEMAGITDVPVTPHKFRHTFARTWLERGGEVYSLSRLMGHSSVKVTEIYLEDFQSRQARLQHTSSRRWVGSSFARRRNEATNTATTSSKRTTTASDGSVTSRLQPNGPQFGVILGCNLTKFRGILGGKGGRRVAGQ